MKEFKGTKSAANYIETEYGTKRFARSVATDDIPSLLDLMNDFSDFNLKQSKATELLSMLIEARDKLSTVNDPVTSCRILANKISELIKQATEV